MSLYGVDSHTQAKWNVYRADTTTLENTFDRVVRNKVKVYYWKHSSYITNNQIIRNTVTRIINKNHIPDNKWAKKWLAVKEQLVLELECTNQYVVKPLNKQHTLHELFVYR